jgi:hypothetical protein
MKLDGGSPHSTQYLRFSVSTPTTGSTTAAVNDRVACDGQILPQWMVILL